MDDRDGRLVGLATALSDGTPVDWDAAESSATSDAERAQIRRMRIVQQVADAQGGAVDLTAWGPLRVDAPIGHGRFGDVYRAWDPRLDREVALKLLRRHDPAGDGVESVVIEEGRMLARIRHPNVVTVFGAERIDGRVGLWMEFVSGRTLEQELGERGAFAPTDAARVGVDVCRALEAVHRAGLVHRDVKAQNVMRDLDGRIVLMDFGTGREINIDSPPELAGTPLYLAPETLAGAPASPQSDVYSVGVLLYRLLSATFPIPGRTLSEIRDAHVRGDTPDIDAALAGVPQDLSAVVRRALATRPADRFATAADMAAALEASDLIRAVPAVSAWRNWWASPVRAAAGVVVVASAVALTAWGVQNLRVSGGPSRQRGPTLVCEGACANQFSSLSPDGRQIVFADGATGDLAIRDVASGSVTRLFAKLGAEKDTDASEPVFSADGSQIAYLWSPGNGSGAQVRVMKNEARAPSRTIATILDAPVILAAWSPDGSRILGEVMRKDRSVDLVWISVADGTMTVLRSLGFSFRPPLDRASVSPDGRVVTFPALVLDPIKSWPYRPTQTDTRVYLIRSDGTGEIELTSGAGVSRHPTWARDGRSLVYTSNVAGSTDLWSLPMRDGRPEGEPTLVWKDIGEIELPAVVTGGAFYFLQFQTGARHTAIWSLDGVGARTPVATFVGSRPAWSPDGGSVAFMRPKPGTDSTFNLIVRTIENSTERSYSHDGMDALPPLWFHDGLGILKLVSDSGGQYWNRIDVESREFKRLVVNSGNPSVPTHMNIRTLSPNGRTIYFGVYGRGRTGPLDRIVALDIASGRYREVVKLPGHQDSLPTAAQQLTIAVDPSDRTIALMRYDPKAKVTHLARVGVDGSGYRDLCEPFRMDFVRNKLAWTEDGRSIFFSTNDDKGMVRIMRINADGGVPEFTGVEVQDLDAFDVSPDGKRLATTSSVLVGSRSELKVLDLKRLR